MANRDTLTPARIDQLESGRICDPLTPGLRIEGLSRGKKRWKFRRRLPGRGTVIKMNFGLFPAFSIAEARAWARQINEQVEAGLDPRRSTMRSFWRRTRTTFG